MSIKDEVLKCVSIGYDGSYIKMYRPEQSEREVAMVTTAIDLTLQRIEKLIQKRFCDGNYCTHCGIIRRTDAPPFEQMSKEDIVKWRESGGKVTLFPCVSGCVSPQEELLKEIKGDEE